ncbi:MAG: hypothetical protein LBS71_00385 [Puniceicoccales bacterium]|jgi:membrane protein involved in colicin uptake|nr:hypothetical protein [Puniceicoccales bacterium]
MRNFRQYLLLVPLLGLTGCDTTESTLGGAAVGAGLGGGTGYAVGGQGGAAFGAVLGGLAGGAIGHSAGDQNEKKRDAERRAAERRVAEERAAEAERLRRENEILRNRSDTSLFPDILEGHRKRRQKEELDNLQYEIERKRLENERTEEENRGKWLRQNGF